jgi:hypothetical protein
LLSKDEWKDYWLRVPYYVLDYISLLNK